jgi:hypothetical protein
MDLVLSSLRSANSDLINGVVADARDMGIIESYLLKVKTYFNLSNG